MQIQNRLLKDLEWKKLGDKYYFEILSSGIESFNDEKEYLSTESIQNTKIKKIECKIKYTNRPSRSNMLPLLHSTWFARMQNTLKVYCFNKDNLEEIKRFILSTGFCGIKVNNKKVDPEYIKYFFISNIFNKVKDSLCSGATQKAIKNESIKRIEIPIPPLDIQKKIVSILEKVEKLKQEIKKANEETNKIIKSVFYEIFGNPVKNEKGWKEVMINDIAINKKGSIKMGPFGSQLKKKELVNKGIRVLWIENIVDNEFNFKAGKFITKEKYSDLEGFTVKPKNVLITMMGTVGRVAVVPDTIDLAIISSHLLKIEVDEFKCNPIFLKYMILSSYVQKQLLSASHGIVMGGLNTSIIKNIKIFLPKVELQNKFAEQVKKIEKIKLHQQKSEQEINVLFDSLTQKAFNGELVK